MLAKQGRLVKQKDFEKVFKRGRSFYSKFMGVRVFANQLEFNRFGIVISSKISKKATLRNRLKRRLTEALREVDHKLKPGLDVVLIALPGFLCQDYGEIGRELAKVFSRLKLYK